MALSRSNALARISCVFICFSFSFLGGDQNEFIGLKPGKLLICGEDGEGGLVCGDFA